MPKVYKVRFPDEHEGNSVGRRASCESEALLSARPPEATMSHAALNDEQFGPYFHGTSAERGSLVTCSRVQAMRVR